MQHCSSLSPSCHLPGVPETIQLMALSRGQKSGWDRRPSCIALLDLDPSISLSCQPWQVYYLILLVYPLDKWRLLLFIPQQGLFYTQWQLKKKKKERKKKRKEKEKKSCLLTTAGGLTWPRKCGDLGRRQPFSTPVWTGFLSANIYLIFFLDLEVTLLR